MSYDLIDTAIHTVCGYPSEVVCLFSGGGDSLTATHLVMENHPRASFAAHIDTGTGIKETQEFVIETCRKYGWPLKIYRAVECGQYYRDLVLKWGFPGPRGHGLMYQRLKERALRKLCREHKRRRDRIMLISGCRSDESVRRMGTVEPIQMRGRQCWVAPIHDWSKDDCIEYLATHNIETNPVSEKLGMSGECLCGAFAHPGELDTIRQHFPSKAAEIEALEREVRAAGHEWGWNDRPPTKPKNCPTVPDGQSLCHSCGKV